MSELPARQSIAWRSMTRSERIKAEKAHLAEDKRRHRRNYKSSRSKFRRGMTGMPQIITSATQKRWEAEKRNPSNKIVVIR